MQGGGIENMEELIYTKDNKVVILGLGYVGLPLAIAMAERQFNVIGIEIREEVVRSINNGIPHFYEPTMQERLQKVVKEGCLRAFNTIPDDCDADVFIITVGTPLGKDGRVRLDMVVHAITEVAQKMKDNSLIILRSTVKLGTTRNIVKPILDKTNCSYHLAFCPERILEGQALKDLFELPQIVAGSSEEAMIRAERIFQRLTPTVIKVRSLETAEMIKLVDNTWRDVRFGYANEIAKICDVVGANAFEVINAGRKEYPRTDVALPGLVGGPCLSKDSYILQESVEALDISLDIIMSARKTNELQPAESVEFITKMIEKIGGFPKRLKIALLGLAFKGKPATDDLRGTMAVPVLEELRKKFDNAEFFSFDAIVSSTDVHSLGINYADSLEKALAETHLALILNNHPIFENYSVARLTYLMAKPAIVYDFWNTMDVYIPSFTDNVFYISVGSHKLCETIIETKLCQRKNI